MIDGGTVIVSLCALVNGLSVILGQTCFINFSMVKNDEQFEQRDGLLIPSSQFDGSRNATLL